MTVRSEGCSKLHVSPDGRGLVDESGVPFFWLGDSGWALFARLDLSESTFYLRDRKEKGFNVIQTFYAAKWLPTNRAGDPPFLDAGPTRLNPRYLDHVDEVIGVAEDLNIYVCFGVGQVVRPDSPWYSADPAILYRYALDLSERLRHRSNIIWNLGQDRDAVAFGADLRPLVPALAHGIADGVNGESTEADDADYSTTLMTYHAATSSGKWFHEARWLDFNMIQTYLGVPRIIDEIAVDYNMTPHKPILHAEGAYEDGSYGYGEHWVTPHMVRKQAYWSVFSGAMGHTYGASGVYQFHSDDVEPGSAVTPNMAPWKVALGFDGSKRLQYLQRLMRSRPVSGRVPDSSLAEPLDEVGSHDRIRTIRATDASHAFVYIPTGAPIRVDLSQMSDGNAAMEWYDPRTGDSTSAERSVDGHHAVMIPPSSGPDQDWVLVLDSMVEDLAELDRTS